MSARQQSSTAYPITFLLVKSIDHITGLTGATPTVTISKNGGAFGAVAGAVSEIANGWYALAGNATDRDTLGELLIHVTCAGCDPVDFKVDITLHDPYSDTVANVTLVDTTTTNTDMLTAAAVNAEVVDCLNVDTYAEPAAVPAATATFRAMLHWLFTLSRNKYTQTATTATVRNDADGANIATATVSDDGTTFTRGEFS